ncbi:PREDICTED: kinesin-like protein KIFC1 [Nanorana parkeri]|uniref:kinesin-like protein KIFC1 n=1 Tax=Nanorana parkeri TaxID=125878 RepID=UPI000854ACD3|nr:PREDICTED: kinesin-like protein KIFC1 [Nanorana parkeri]
METSLEKKQQQQSLRMSRLPVPPRKRQLSDENQEQMSRVKPVLGKRLRASSPETELPKVRVAASIATTRPRVAPAVAFPKPPVIGRQSLAVINPRNRANVTGKRWQGGVKVSISATTPAPLAGAKKRAAWDLKGQVNDMKDKMTNYKGKVQCLSGENARLLSTKEQLQKHVETMSIENAGLSERLRTAEFKLQSQQQRLTNSESEVQRLTGLCQRQESELSNEKQTVQELRETSHSLAEQLKDKEQKLICLERENSRLKTLVSDQSAEISSLKRTVEERDMQVHTLETDRRRLHNTIQELKGNIRVFCRVRPILQTEKNLPAGNLIFPPNDEKAIVLTKVEESHIGREKSQSVKYDFNFDCIFPATTGQAAVFEEISLLVQSALDGYPVCIFAYGQTGSGKTYTMEGPDNVSVETMGMIPRAIRQIFSSAAELKTKGWEYKFTASFLEIYNESIRDLLANRPDKKHEYEIRKVNTTSNEVYVTNLRYVEVSSVEEVHDLLHAAKTHRSVAKTALNDRSSRSHSVFQLKIEGENKLRDVHTSSVLSLIDLAGSERLDRSLSTGDRLKETQSINTSLSTLGMVITSLCNKDSHIPYRNSRLTYLLQNSLGGNSKVLMFVNISPLEENFTESLNSLRFASKVNECVIGTARANRK